MSIVARVVSSAQADRGGAREGRDSGAKGNDTQTQEAHIP